MNRSSQSKSPMRNSETDVETKHVEQDKLSTEVDPPVAGVNSIPVVSIDADVEKQISTQVDTEIVDWDGVDDPHNPLNWTKKRKWAIIILVSAVTFNDVMASTIFAPGVPQVQQEFHNSDGSEASLLVSIFIIGLAIGPLFLAPLSEFYGRVVMIHVSNIVFLIASILCAASVNLPMLIVFRLITGLGCSVPLTVGGGCIADLIEQKRRGRALAIFGMGPTLGPVIGPVIGGYIALDVSWRWSFWLVTILSGVMTVACFVLMDETYAPKILERKAERLRRQTGNPKLKSKFDKGQTPRQALQLAIVRTVKMITRCPSVGTCSLFVAIEYSYTYLLISTLTPIFEDVYGFNAGEAGLAFLGMGVGFLIGQTTVGHISDWYLARRERQAGKVRPEDRLPLLVFGAFLYPIGLFWYGWTAQYHIHWIMPIIGTAICGLALLFVYFAAQVYLVDAYTMHAASALGASAVLRCVSATVIPLAGPALYARLDLGWGNSLLGFLALAFAPLSLLLLKYGEALRVHPKFQPNL